tara:strand:- start:1694 stop:2389 length:696 start_codon:yes stop_codon:yes gene_type:complete
MYSNIKWTDDFSYHGYRHGNLYYIPVQKCASTYYRIIFDDILQWEETHLTCKELENFTVFAHMRDPIDRYIAGLMTYLGLNKLEDILDDDRFSHLFTTYGIVFDGHTSPHSFAVPDILNTEWLLLNHPEKERMGNFLLFWFLHHHGIDIDLEYINNLPMQFVAEKTPYWINIRNKLNAGFQKSDEIVDQFDVKTNRLFYYDQYVYNLVNENTQYWKQSWPEISWLNNYRQS